MKTATSLFINITKFLYLVSILIAITPKSTISAKTPREKTTDNEKTEQKRARYFQESEESNCLICLEELKNPDKPVAQMTLLTCDHAKKYHQSCLCGWLISGTPENPRSCPICRAPKKAQIQQVSLQQLFYAIKENNITLATELILSGININSNNDEQTALHYAVSLNNYEITKALLLQPSIEVNLRDNLGQTALQIAVENDNIEIVEALVNHPDININTYF